MSSLQEKVQPKEGRAMSEAIGRIPVTVYVNGYAYDLVATSSEEARKEAVKLHKGLGRKSSRDVKVVWNDL